MNYIDLSYEHQRSAIADYHRYAYTTTTAYNLLPLKRTTRMSAGLSRLFLHILARGHRVINAQLQGVANPSRALPRIRRVGPSAFWLLFAIEGLFVALVLILVLQFALPARAPLSRGADYSAVREAIWSRLNGAPDPLIEIAPGITARESNLRGFSLRGQTYYYYIEGRRGYDPFSRGVVGPDAIEVVLRDDGGPQTLVIYRLLG
jgi:hypothetical protein